jgi:CHAD domain-containing protein
VSHVLGAIEPQLREAGAPPRDQHAGDAAGPPARIVRAPDFQDAVLHLLACACELQADDGAAHGAKDEVRKRLAKLRTKALRDGVRFERLGAARQHRVRKRLKRLRYLAEFTAPLHGRKALKAYLAKLKKAQDALGEYNDGMTALAHYRETAGEGAGAPAHQDAHAWFAIGWLQAQRERLARDCGRRLRKLAKADPFWR